MMTFSPRFVVMSATAGLLLVSLLTCASPSPTAEPPAPPDPGEASTAAPGSDDSPSDTPAPVELEPQPTKMPPARSLVPEPVPTLEPGRVTGDVPPDLLDAILADAEAQSGIRQEEFTVVRAEAVVWNDGSLGCPQPGMMYTQAQVDGYWVVLEAGEQQYDYRANDRGYFVLCEGGLREEGLPPSEGSSPEVDQ
ncbi:MAG: hypothetical protein M8467_05800 [Anaerolineae bacterium]|nr:hypothetical protein [Anaerolineae bacterium]